MIRNEEFFSQNVCLIREKPKCGNFLGKARNGKTKIVDFLSPMGRISILKAVLWSVDHADSFEYKEDCATILNKEVSFWGGWPPPRRKNWRVGDLRTWTYPKILCFYLIIHPMAHFRGVPGKIITKKENAYPPIAKNTKICTLSILNFVQKNLYPVHSVLCPFCTLYYTPL